MTSPLATDRFYWESVRGVDILSPHSVVLYQEDIELKHLPGRHDQQRHDPTKGVGSVRAEQEYTKFSDVQKANTWLAETPGVNPKVSWGEDVAALNYKGVIFEQVNKDLREGTHTLVEGESLEPTINALDDIIQRTNVPTAIVAYRGMNSRVLSDEVAVGKVIQDKAFVSVSLNEEVANEYAEGIVAEIRIPAGSKALNMEKWSWQLGLGDAEEAELLLRRGSKFRIVGDSGSAGDVRKVIMELVDD